MVKVFPFIFKAKHKTLYVIWAAELENSTEKQFAWSSIDQSLQIYTIKPAVHLIQLYQKHIFEQPKSRLNVLIMVCQHYTLKF